MQFNKTELKDAALITPTVYRDERGFFLETYRECLLKAAGIDCQFVQDNHSRSTRGTLRGLHFQYSPGQAKLVRCASGTVYDVIVDLRKDSPTYKQWQGFELSDDNQHQLFIPVGFAHGFCVLSDVADFVYKCSSYYDADTEGSLAYDDPTIGVDWPTKNELIVSDRDRKAPLFTEIEAELNFYLS